MKTKNFYSKMACALIFMAVACLTISCKKDKEEPTPEPTPTPTVTCYYKYLTDCDRGLSVQFMSTKLYPTSADERKINSYFEEKGIKPLASFIEYEITGETEAECDAKAAAQIKAEWEATAPKLVVNEIQPLLQDKTTFNYYWARYEIDENNQEVYDTVGTWNCPINTNFDKYGKLTFGDEEFEITRSDLNYLLYKSIVMELTTLGGTNEFSVLFKNTEVLPSEEVAIEQNTSVQGVIKYNAKNFYIKGSIKLTKKSDYVYSIDASGQAANDDGRPINFTLNCVDVPF